MHAYRLPWLLAAGLMLVSAAAAAERSKGAILAADARPVSFEFDETYALGIVEHRVDHETEVTGWRLNRSWYVGQQDGEDDAFSLVWQRERSQVSISSEGFRFTRRF